MKWEIFRGVFLQVFVIPFFMSSSSLRESHSPYDKFTYPTKRKAEKNTVSSPVRGLAFHHMQEEPPQYAPLPLTKHGFAIAEDGVLMHRAVSPLRYHISDPMTRSALPLPGDNVKGTTAWDKLLSCAGNDLEEDELYMLYWESLQALLTHYGITNPVEIARIQIVWKKRQAQAQRSAECTSSAGGVVPLQGSGTPQLGKERGRAPPQYADATSKKPTYKKRPVWTTQGKGGQQ